MRFNSDIHHRQSTRIRAYDYSRHGAYFFTIATANRESMFGEVCNGNMSLNISGDKVAGEWRALPSRFCNVILDEFIVMPNHIHGILIIDCADCKDENKGAASGAPTLGAIIRCLKSRSAIAVNKMHNRSGVPVWQRNYWDRIIRNESELHAFRTYIQNNPQQWHADLLFP
jgi:putative transposase